MAARRLQIYLSHSENQQGHEYMFGDLSGGRFISGRRKPDKKSALVDACQELQNYLCTET